MGAGKPDGSLPGSPSGAQAFSAVCPSEPGTQSCLHPGCRRTEACTRGGLLQTRPEAEHGAFSRRTEISVLEPEDERVEFQEQLPSLPLMALLQVLSTLLEFQSY